MRKGVSLHEVPELFNAMDRFELESAIAELKEAGFLIENIDGTYTPAINGIAVDLA